MTKQIRTVLLCGALFFGLACPKGATVLPEKATAEISSAHVKAHVTKLAADDMEGRGLGTKGIEAAAQYIADEMKAAGAQPGGEQGSWFQGFDMTVAVGLGSPNTLATTIPAAALTDDIKEIATDAKRSARVEWNVETTWTPLGLSESGTVSGDVVFAGYGISAPEYDYDDYADVDVQDKVVLVMQFEPGENDPNSPFAGTAASRYSMLRYKAIRARELGAKAVLFVTPYMGHEGEDELLSIETDFTTKGSVVSAHVRREIAERLLATANLRLRDVQKQIEETGKPQSAELNAAVDLTITLEPTRKRAKNVVALIPGSDPKLSKQYVVVGAHYDHLGLGSAGTSLDPNRIGQVHNGADDNASGTAALLEIARALGRSEPKPKRSLVLIAFSAEEAGLGGSSHYVKNPIYPLDETVAMLNMDMIGRLRKNKVHAFGSQTAKEFESILEKANTEDLEIDAHGDGYGPSDHTPFYSQNISVLHFFTGAHEDYHRTTDDADRLNYDGLAQVTRLVTRCVWAIANDAKTPTFQRPKQVDPHARRPAGGSRGYGPYFGSIPDFTEREEPGVRLTGVRDGSPADKAGVQAGDVLIEFGGVEIKNLYDFTYALRQHKPGDEIDVKINRDGEVKTFRVVLGSRGGH